MYAVFFFQQNQQLGKQVTDLTVSAEYLTYNTEVGFDTSTFPKRFSSQVDWCGG